MSDTSVDSCIEQQKFKESAQPSEKYYPITEKEISTFVQHSSQIDRETRSLAQEIYSRGMISLSGDVALIKDLNYEIYKLKNKISQYDIRNNQIREDGAKAALLDFDQWFSARHIGGMSEIIPEVRRELHKRIESLRNGQHRERDPE